MISIAGRASNTVRLTLTWSGCWEVLTAFEDKGLAGTVVIDWRGWKLTGQVDTTRSGLFAGQPAAIIVGGLAWCSRRTWRPSNDDRGLTAKNVAKSIASQLGQTIEVSLDRNLGRIFMPRNESGGAILTRLYGKDWHIGTDGVARVQKRPTPAIGKSVAVLKYEPRDGMATVYADRPDQAPLGALLPKDSRLTTNRRITKLVASASGSKERIVCYTEAV